MGGNCPLLNKLSMDTEAKLKNELKKLFKKQRLAVLATHKNGQPYSSLVAFAVTEDLKHIIFATSRSTRKYEHFSSDGRVALLIDNRTNKVADFHSAIAVTAVGTAMEPDENRPTTARYSFTLPSIPI